MSRQHWDWEDYAVEAVGSVIEFWGFKRNQGRVWALLYVAAEPLSSAEIQEKLGLSKAAVSILSRELEQWRVVAVSKRVNDGMTIYEASIDFLGMLGRVLRRRELEFLGRVRDDLQESLRRAKKSLELGEEGIGVVQVQRIERMVHLAGLFEEALHVMIDTLSIDFGRFREVLNFGGERIRRALGATGTER